MAYFNGANDNFKGVATLFGSKTVNYKTAIFFATLTTFAGSISSLILAEKLLKNFSGKGLVPEAIASSANFQIAVVLGAGLTVMLATLIGFPISTTHSLTGALVGSGLVAIGTQVNLIKLGNSFFLPLLLSPIIAIILGMLLYGLLHGLRNYLGIKKQWCICLGNTQKFVPITEPNLIKNLPFTDTTELAINTLENCQKKYVGDFLGIQNQQIIDTCHWFSAGIVSYSRGLNDTPKIVAILLLIDSFSIRWGMLAVGLAMAIGGLLNAKKIAEIMSQKITEINHGQGLSANLVTGFLVIIASNYGLPVSTTHVSVGSIFGVGLLSKKANYRIFSQIVLSWILTLPIAILISGIISWLLTK